MSLGRVSNNVDSFSRLNKSTLRISKSIHEKKTKLKETYAITIVPGFGGACYNKCAGSKKRKTST